MTGIKKVMVTGGCGFIGTNFVKRLLRETDFDVHILDALTYAGNLENYTLEVRDNPRFQFTHGDIRDPETVENVMSRCDVVVHLAAETHVDRSIAEPDAFITTEFFGSYVLLDAARHLNLERFIFISTSEVYGSALHVPMTEDHPLNPQSPYAGAKAGADRLAYSFFRTFDMPLVIIRPFNNYGYYHYPEKLIPLFITNAMRDLPLPLYGSGDNTRDWLFAEDTADALHKALNVPIQTVKGETINLGTGKDYSARHVGGQILTLLGKPQSLLQTVPDRPAHVERLVADFNKAKRLLGWSPTVDFEVGLAKTVEWYQNNKQWWEKVIAKRVAWDPRREWPGYTGFLSKS
ncbi:MAG: dTDP-glucose 4,6-dehydratase [bacterium]